MKILITDDSILSRTITRDALVKLGHTVVCAASGEEAIALFQTENPDLIILDVVMNGMNGFQCAAKIRALSRQEWIPIIFLSSVVDDESVARGIDAGGDDYLCKPFSEITLAAKIKSMERIAEMRHKLLDTTKKLEVLSTTDVLTNVYNRLQFDKTLKEVIAEDDRHQRVSALLFIDVDHFKHINDTLGHHNGDLLLKEASKRLSSCLRRNDFLARLGGDEFGLILRTIQDKSIVEGVAKKICSTFTTPFLIDNHQVNITLSIGVAYYPDNGKDPTTLMQNADIALYKAKRAGRNQYQFF